MGRLLQHLPWRRRSRTGKEIIDDARWVAYIHEWAEERKPVWGWT